LITSHLKSEYSNYPIHPLLKLQVHSSSLVGRANSRCSSSYIFFIPIPADPKQYSRLRSLILHDGIKRTRGVCASRNIHTPRTDALGQARGAGELLLLLLLSACSKRERNIQMRRRRAADKKREKRRRGGKTKVESSLKVVKVNPFLAARDAG
jgi:hypothetical protein